MTENGNTTEPPIHPERRELSMHIERRELSMHIERRELAIASADNPLPWLIRSLQQKHRQQTEESRRRKESGEETS